MHNELAHDLLNSSIGGKLVLATNTGINNARLPFKLLRSLLVLISLPFTDFPSKETRERRVKQASCAELSNYPSHPPSNTRFPKGRV